MRKPILHLHHHFHNQQVPSPFLHHQILFHCKFNKDCGIIDPVVETGSRIPFSSIDHHCF